MNIKNLFIILPIVILSRSISSEMECIENKTKATNTNEIKSCVG